ncbi:MAG TPA: hypothetical protein V6C65_38395 [Allocoleopsis sp.]
MRAQEPPLEQTPPQTTPTETAPTSDETLDEADPSEADSSEEPVEEPSLEESADPSTLDTDPNPLNPVGESLDTLIQMQMNGDMWTAMMGELPCLEATEPCIHDLQEMAIGNSPALTAIDERIELVNQKIEEARANNQRTINLGAFEPALQFFLKVEDLAAVAETRDSEGNIITPAVPAHRRGFFDRLGDLFSGSGTLGVVNDLLNVIGIPLFQAVAGTDPNRQQREIAIADLQVKIAEIENKRGELANQIREQVTLQVLDFDTIRREFQIAQEVARRDSLRLDILTLDYRFAATGTMDTPRYLNEISALDQQKADTFRAWARLRSQLVRVKLLVLGSE